MASSQHRCVFVGNIPYDATEEQLIEICQEVGPVVSFRLVIDRETGKPKGYGFCEYKDEETALSARRNLQGYEINGRQLRVDFAENDKGNDRNREQGRGGPGLAANVEPQKQIGSSAVHGDAQHQPIGLHIAITAASVMTAALGGAQVGIQSGQNGLQNQSALAHDPLTLHLAKMSRSQLNEILSEVKAMATQNKDMARQLLLSRPQLPKALFQAQIMLGMVTPQVLQMPNIRMVSDQASQSLVNEAPLNQPALVQTMSGLPHPGQSKLQYGLTTYVQEGVNTIPHNPLIPNQLTTHPRPPMQPRMLLQQHSINNVGQLGTLSGQSNLMLPSIRPPSLGSLPVRPPIQPSTSAALNPQMHASLPQRPALVGSSTLGHNIQMIRPDASFQPGPSISSGISHLINHDSSESFIRPSKLMKLDEERNASVSLGIADMPVSNGSSHVIGNSSLPINAAPKAEMRYSEPKSSQPQLPSDVESVLLQQVLNLTPEQLSSLPPEQQQQVIQLQQALRRDQMQPS